MKNKKNTLITFALILSFALNFYTLNQNITLRDSINSQGSINHTQSQQVNSLEISSSVTDIVDKVQNKVVSVVNMVNNVEAGSGSGIVYKNDGKTLLVVTNHHVIDGGNGYSIQFSNGERSDAELVGSDQYTDLALLKVSVESDIKPFEIGDSQTTKVGEFVIAIGSPLGLEYANSVTFGIISGKDRVVPVDLNNDGRSDWDMIVTQTDAAINPGNSGGALVNMAGQLVGINSMKLSSTQVEGMGFSIPVTEMIRVVEQLEEKGKVDYPMVGISAISLEDLNSYYYRQFNIDTKLEGGVFIAEILDGGASQTAGLQEGDVITKFNGEDVSNFKDFRRKLFSQNIGDTVQITVNRSGETLTKSLILK